MNPPNILAAALMAAALAMPAAAQGVFISPPPSDAATSGALTGQRADIARELPYLGYHDVDVRRLSNGQVTHIANLIHSDRSQGDIKSHVGAAIRGNGILQRVIDGLGGR